MCVERRRAPRRSAQRGMSLVELVVALALAGVLLGALWSAWALMGRTSADPLVARQQLAIAQSLLGEIGLQPLSGTAVASMPGRTGYGSVMDYDGLAMNGIVDVEGQAIDGLAAYRATVAVSPRALAGVPAGSGWWITVTVTGPSGGPLTLGLWRSAR